MTQPAGSVRVVHWCPHFPIGGGIAGSVLALSRAQRDLGADTIVVAPASPRKPLFAPEDGVGRDELLLWAPARSLRLGNMAFHSISPRDRRRLTALNADVVHVHAEFNPDNLRVPRLFACPLVLSPHGAFHPLVLGSSLLRNKIAYARVARHLLYRHVAAFHALTPLEGDHIRHLLPGASVYCVPQGSTLPAAEGRAPPPGDVPGRVRLLFLGRLDVYTKGLDVLVEAFALAARRLPHLDLRLSLVGPGTERARRVLEQQARGLNVADSIDLPGTASRCEVAQLLETHSVYLHLSRHEGLSMSTCEALATGMPAVLSVAACPFEEIVALDHVCVVEPVVEEAAEAIVATVSDLEQRRAAARRALPFVHTFFSWPRIAEAHLTRYAQISRARERERCEAGHETRAFVR